MPKLSHALIGSLVLFIQLSCGPTHVVVESPAPPAPAPPPPVEVSYQQFYDALSPYGEWINDPEYGYVWMPNVGPDFKPYATNGNWVYTDEGWTWASGYSWGWAPFHYGRWFYEEGYGWMWMPGNEWAPAWVSWRQNPQYYGWAPLGPSISISAGAGYNPPAHYWCFVPQQYVTSPHVTNYYVNEQQNVTIINNTTVIHNTTIINHVNNTAIDNSHANNTRVNNYAGGPDPTEVSRVTGTQIRPIAVRETNTPGDNRSTGSLAIYRPRINGTAQGTGGTTAGPAPAHTQTISNVRPVNTTVYTNTGRYNNNNRGAANSTGNAPVNPSNVAQQNRGALQPATPPKPAANPNSTAGNGTRNNANNGNVNGHPGQPAGNANGRKPKPNQGQGKQDKKHKPDQTNPDHHP